MTPDFTTKEKAQLFDRLFASYVVDRGLGSMQKADFDALVLWLVADAKEEFDPFVLSSWFKIKETRVKSLLETAAVKFAATTAVEAWETILQDLAKAEVDVASLERGEVRFPLANPALFRWLQARVRDLRAAVQYDRHSEEVVLNIDVLYRILDGLWDSGALGTEWTSDVHAEAQKNIQAAIGRIGKKIAGNDLEDLRKRKSSHLRERLAVAANLGSIGSLVLPLLEKFGK